MPALGKDPARVAGGRFLSVDPLGSAEGIGVWQLRYASVASCQRLRVVCHIHCSIVLSAGPGRVLSAPGVPLAALESVRVLVVLVCITVAAVKWRQRCPYLLVGWLWYVGTLVPVSGSVFQVGSQAMADRFTYLPQIGLYLALAWGLADLCRSWRHRRWWSGLGSALVLAVLMGVPGVKRLFGTTARLCGSMPWPVLRRTARPRTAWGSTWPSGATSTRPSPITGRPSASAPTTWRPMPTWAPPCPRRGGGTRRCALSQGPGDQAPQ